MAQSQSNDNPEIGAVAFHTSIADEFGASYREDPNRLDRIVIWRTYLARYVSHAVLAYDLGCGPAVLTCEVAKRADKVIAIDGSAGMLEVAKRTIETAGVSNVTFEQQLLPFTPGEDHPPASCVISSSVIEYLEDLDEAFQFVRKLISPDGVFIFSLSNKLSISRKLVRLFHRVTGRPRYFGHVKHFVTVHEITKRLEAAKFVCVEHEYFGGADRLNTALSKFMPRNRSTNMILFVARPVSQES
ncbi:class I SAM-dependent DNA methyltransferase [Phenylobacterium conjunctum]|uniref:Class I SAM-dependent DNA methyltransferase n=1 Tax=Phenylobacterium conjunctum TaxID=1298959 RepID=A0ABW3T465_9CAUL